MATLKFYGEDSMQIVIVGGVAAGVTAATRLRRLMEDAKIILIERGEKISFANCALPYYAGGLLKPEGLYAAQAGVVSARNAVDIRERHEVLSIDREAKKLSVKNLVTGEVYALDYDKLILEVSTDGSIHPKDALKEAAKILIYHFMLFSDEKITLENTDVDGNQEFDEEVLHMRQLLKTRLVDMNLSVRALNCLKAADVETLGDLVQYNKTDLLKFRNFGKKSLTELDDLLESLNLSFGTDISKYKLDKE